MLCFFLRMGEISLLTIQGCHFDPTITVLDGFDLELAPSLDEDPTCYDHQVMWVASDFTSSWVGSLTIPPKGIPSASTGISSFFNEEFGQDLSLSFSTNRAFLLSRDRELLFLLNRCGAPVQKMSLHLPSTQSLSSPHDVALSPNEELWVVYYDVPVLAVFNQKGEWSTSIDLSPYSPNGNPHASALWIGEFKGLTKALVLLQNLNRDWKPENPASLLSINVDNKQIEEVIQLKGRNPLHSPVFSQESLWVTQAGNLTLQEEENGGIERIDLVEGTSEMLLSKTELEAIPVNIAISQTCGAAIVMDSTPDWNRTSLITFRLDTGTLVASIAKPLFGPTSHYDLWGIDFNSTGQVLMVGDRQQKDLQYPIHLFHHKGNCVFVEDTSVNLPQKPIAIHTLPPRKTPKSL
ncbi:hypothetical protein [Pajaroellobacter abortibovis]|uniref:Uncharacterized protein n=1 Tax=Pajaroellobacter abortibovis TaxID=1882918 RepID=A0A1L6MV65_9BACT|nr:hypothetical protein [Pajaroellobacter abortibovis]APR99402.1 hypothetical protein BCY86_00935 [Pajaroellobacter abortibovis]